MYSSLSPSIFQVLLRITTLAEQFSLYLLHLRSGFRVFLFLSPLPPLLPFDTFLDNLLHIWSQSSSLICLWLVFQSPTLVLPLCAIALPVTCCLYFSIHAKNCLSCCFFCCEGVVWPRLGMSPNSRPWEELRRRIYHYNLVLCLFLELWKPDW